MPTTLLRAACLVTCAVLALARPAAAQDSTTGAIAGRAIDRTSGEPMAYATIVVVGPGIATQTVLADDHGTFKITGLPPRAGYVVTGYYADSVAERRGVRVGVGRTTPVILELDGEIILVEDDLDDLAVDPTSPALGHTFDRDAVTKVGYRDLWSAAASGPTSHNDGVGIATAGSSGNENVVYVDGVNTTGLAYGTAGAPVIADFLEELQVITGGFGAEYGRSTGGVINVVTRTGTNEVAGSAFAYVTPGALVASRVRTPSQATSIDARTDLAYQVDVGVEVGGPIRKDHAWFWIGVAPQAAASTTTRVTRRRTDCRVRLDSGALSTPAGQPCTADAIAAHADGVPDVDPATGFLIHEDLDAQRLATTSRGAQLLGKLTWAVAPEHQGQLAVSAQPGASDGQRTYGFVEEQRLRTTNLTTDASFKWTSKLHDNQTELEAVAGVHREAFRFGSPGGARDGTPLQVLYFGDLGTWSRLGGESMASAQGCADNQAGDPYRFIVNCPDEGVGYAIGGPGSLADDVEQRLAARVGVTRRIRAAGGHEVKAGIDVEDNRLERIRAFSGAAFLQNLLDRAEVRAQRWVRLAADGAGAHTCRDAGRGDAFGCDLLGADDPAARVRGRTIHWAAYLRDSWQPRPDVTINAGVRYEEQRLRYADHLRGTIDPLTGRALGDDALALRHLWSPRIGAAWDPTKEARGKLFGHWGRFYESIPLDINDRAFGGEVLYEQRFDAGTQCGPAVDGIGGADGAGCLAGGERPANGELLSGSGVLVAPGLRGQYLDELVLGAEYEITDGLVVGAAWQARRLGRVIEDVSTDDAATYVIANPGEWSADDERRLRDRIAAEDDPAARARLEAELAQYLGIRRFDRARRDYDAVQLTATHRASAALFLQASYTYARTRGNCPGLASYDNGQVDPNISSQFDLIELLANRDGPLPQDRPHTVKLDGYYVIDLRRAGAITVGARARALSGTPVDVLAGHYRYGAGESFLLPRGSWRRTGVEASLDLHVAYGRDLGRGFAVEVFADVFNVLNDQGTFSVDERYTYLSNANPVVGGTYDDLIWVKEVSDEGAETSAPIRRNPNFGQVAGRYAPLSARFGARLTF